MESRRIAMISTICAIFLLAGFTAGFAADQQTQTDKSQAPAQSESQGQNQQMAQDSVVTEGTQLHISPATLRFVQKQLNIRGFSTGAVDGVWGEGTSQALSKFQKIQGLEPTGNVTLETLEFLGISQELQKSGRAEKLQQMVQAQEAGQGAPIFVSPSAVRQIQQQLSTKGFDPGPIDGLWGPNTQAAVRKFEKEQGMAPSGNINISMISSIGLDQMVASLTTTGQQQQQQQQGQQQMAQAQQGQQQQQVRGYYGPQGQKTGQDQQFQQRSGREGFIPLRGREQQQFAGEGAPLFVSADVVKQIEQKLEQAGYQVGNTDGKWDNQTSQAIRNYQEAENLEPTGNLNLRTMNIMLGGLSADMFRTGGGGQGQQQSQ